MIQVLYLALPALTVGVQHRGGHIGIGYSSCAGVVSGQPIGKLGTGATANQLFGWGIAHEIGHNMDKLGRATAAQWV